MNHKIITDAAILVPAVSVTWLDMFDGSLKIAVGIVTLIAVVIRLMVVWNEWKSRKRGIK
jgi:hypothetical protein